MKNHPVIQTEYYQKVKSLVDGLHSAGMLENGSGYCLSMSDIIHKLLHIDFIKSFMFVLLTVSSLNFIRGSYDFYQTYINKNNDWGPNKTFVDKK